MSSLNFPILPREQHQRFRLDTSGLTGALLAARKTRLLEKPLDQQKAEFEAQTPDRAAAAAKTMADASAQGMENTRNKLLQENTVISRALEPLQRFDEGTPEHANAWRQAVASLRQSGLDNPVGQDERGAPVYSLDPELPASKEALQREFSVARNFVETLRNPEQLNTLADIATTRANDMINRARLSKDPAAAPVRFSRDEVQRAYPGLLEDQLRIAQEEEVASRAAGASKITTNVTTSTASAAEKGILNAVDMEARLRDMTRPLTNPATGRLEFEKFLGVWPRQAKFSLDKIASFGTSDKLTAEQREYALRFADFRAALNDFNLELFHQKFGSQQTSNEAQRALDTLLNKEMNPVEFEAALNNFMRIQQRTVKINSLVLSNNPNMRPGSPEFRRAVDRILEEENLRENRERARRLESLAQATPSRFDKDVVGAMRSLVNELKDTVSSDNNHLMRYRVKKLFGEDTASYLYGPEVLDGQGLPELREKIATTPTPGPTQIQPPTVPESPDYTVPTIKP